MAIPAGLGASLVDKEQQTVWSNLQSSGDFVICHELSSTCPSQAREPELLAYRHEFRPGRHSFDRQQSGDELRRGWENRCTPLLLRE